MFIDVNTQFAPILLVVTLAEWPTVEEQIAVRQRLIDDGYLQRHTLALVDFRAVRQVPTREVLAQAVERYNDRPAVVPSDIAFVVANDAQAEVVSQLSGLVSAPCQAFYTETEAIGRLFPTLGQFPVKLLR